MTRIWQSGSAASVSTGCPRERPSATPALISTGTWWILGFKANLSDIQAALLVGQLPRLAKQLERRQQISRMYEQAFSGIDGLSFPAVPADARSARHLFTIWVPPQHRDAALTMLQSRGIGVAVNYRAIHLLSYYRERFGFERRQFPDRRAHR